MPHTIADLEILANNDPARALEAARELATSETDPTQRAHWVRLQGLALALLGDLNASYQVLSDALVGSEGLDDAHAGILTTLGGVAALRGDAEAGLRHIDRAIASASGNTQARAVGQRGTVLNRIGRREEALVAFGEAIERLEGDHFVRLLYMNRGILRIETGMATSGLKDLRMAADIARDAGQDSALAEATHNLGWANRLMGDLPAALAALDRAEDMFTVLGYPLGESFRDRADALADAGLIEEALEFAQRSVEHLAHAGAEAARAESLLVLARVAALAEEPKIAEEAGAAARDLFTGQDRPGWAASADLLFREARRHSGSPATESDLIDVESLISRLDQIGLADDGASARLVAGRMALAIQQPDRAGRWLGEIEKGKRAPAIVRYALAQALMALALDRPEVAASAAADGLRDLDEWRSSMATVEMRAAVSLHTRELVSIGVRHAEQVGDDIVLFDWVERGRGGALRNWTVNPVRDPGLVDALARFRHTADRLRSAEREGQSSGDLRREAASAEEAVRRLVRRTSATGGRVPVVSFRDVRERLGDRTLVQLAVVHDELIGLRLSSSGIERWDIGAGRDVYGLVRRVGRAIKTMADSGRSDRSREAAVAAVRGDLSEVDSALGDLVSGEDELVIVPPSEFQSFPWSLLPSLWPRPVTVAPSATTWMSSLDMTASRGSVMVVAGPGLPAARSEIEAVGAVYPASVTLAGDAATCAAVLGRFETTDLAHIVCHGSFRLDSPMFSVLELADGGLSFYELERVARLPTTIVLSSCDLGLSEARRGDETLGAASALLASGCATVIANPAAVPDTGRTAAFMVDMHRQVAGGSRAAAALAAARRSLDPSDPDDLPVAAFTAIGAG